MQILANCICVPSQGESPHTLQSDSTGLITLVGCSGGKNGRRTKEQLGGVAVIPINIFLTEHYIMQNTKLQGLLFKNNSAKNKYKYP